MASLTHSSRSYSHYDVVKGEKKKNENLVGGVVQHVFVLDDGEREQRTGRLRMKTERDLLVPFFFSKLFFYFLLITKIIFFKKCQT